jgi:hypothetical protein
MNPSPPVIEIHGEDVTVEATYLAARLGLAVDAPGRDAAGDHLQRG